MTKRIGLGRRPAGSPTAEGWVRTGMAGPRMEHQARLTVDISPALRARIKVSAIRRGVTVAVLLRELLEQQFPVEQDQP